MTDDIIPPPDDAIGGELVPVDDAETVVYIPERFAGAVDPPDVPITLYGTILARKDDRRPPIVPAWLRNRDQRKAFTRAFGGLVGYTVAFHGLRLPKYAALTAIWAPVGVGRLAGRQIRWWWLLEQHSMRQHYATKNDGESWMKLHREAKATRAYRGMVLAVELVALAVAVTLLWYAAPEWVAWAVVAVLVPVFARLGRPADRPILDRVVDGPRFTKLTGEMVRNAVVACALTGVKDPGQVTFPPPGIHRDGPGWLARFNLPPGTEAVDLLERRGKLSSALRLPVDQVWPEAGPDHAGQVDLWVGYLPASKMGQPTWDLAKPDARTSFFKPAPIATDARQRPIYARLFETNELVGGAPGSGKSYAARTLATIALLDPTCELKIAEFKGTGDFLDMAPFCSTYVVGVLDEHFEAGRDLIAWVLAECERRGARIKAARERGEAPEGKVTPELAAKPGSGLHPVFVLIDEAHELFGYDKAIGKDAERAIKRGRALGIHLTLATQIPDKDSVPPNITRCVQVRWCLSVTGQVENDMILGTGAYKRGLSATVYRPVYDAGWGVLRGLQADGAARSFYPTPEQTAAIIARARQLRGDRIVGAVDNDRVERRFILDDVLALFAAGERGLHWETIAARLVDLSPTYTGSTAESVSTRLRGLGVRSVDVKVNGVNLKGCRRQAVAAALERQAIEGGSG